MDSRRKESVMAKTNGVSSKTHTQKQLDDYANQHNPNNKAYQARKASESRAFQVKKAKQQIVRSAKMHVSLEDKVGVLAPTDWMCYSNPYDFD